MIGPHMPNKIPAWLPGHLHWFIFSDTGDNQSHYNYGFFTQDPENSFGGSDRTHVLMGSWLSAIAVILHRGIPTSSQWNAIVMGLVFIVLGVILIASACVKYSVSIMRRNKKYC